MKFTIERRLLSKMVQAVGGKIPSVPRDEELRLAVVSGVVYVVGTCRAGGAIATNSQDGGCTVPRQNFEKLLKTFQGDRLLTFGLKDCLLAIESFKMPVTGCSPTPAAPAKFEWFGPGQTVEEPASVSAKAAKTKVLDPNDLSSREDWLGDCIAIECPICQKVFLVDGGSNRERHCPSCGLSRGVVTGPRAKGGKASIIWGDSPAFIHGRKYSRMNIAAVLGGSTVEFLPNANGRVVCGCFTLDHNPEAPEVVIPGTGPIIEREAEIFCAQDYPVPIFIKRRPNEWEYMGRYKADRFSIDPAEIAAHHLGSVTPQNEVTRVIFLRRGKG